MVSCLRIKTLQTLKIPICLDTINIKHAKCITF